MVRTASRRGVLASLGLAATAGTALLSPQRRDGSPALAKSVPAGTWPAPGRDPARTKHAPGASPPTDDARIGWRTPVGVTPWTPSVAVDAGTVYVPSPDALVALDRRSGAVRWRLDLTTLWPPDGREVAVGPLVAGDRVLLAAGQDLLGVDAATGRVRWGRDLGDPPSHAVAVGGTAFVPDRSGEPGIAAVDAATGAVWFRWSTDGTWSPVAFVDGTLLAYRSGAVAAFDPRTGDRLWRTETPGGVSQPTTGIAAGDSVVVGSNPLVALALEDGSVRWRYEAPVGEDEAESFRPATDGDRVYVSAYWAGTTIAFDAATGERVWQVDDRLGSPIVAGGTVYLFGDGGVTALRATDGGRRGAFGSSLVPPGGAATTLVAAGDRLYAAVVPTGDGAGRPTVVEVGPP